MSGFKDFGLRSNLYGFLEESGLKNPTEVQKKAIHPFLSSKNLAVLAQTGTGKTLAYALPLVEKLKLFEERESSEEKELLAAPRAVVIAPTRELCGQIQHVFKEIAHHVKIRVRMLSGGDRGATNRSLRKDYPDILITSPARFLSALESGELKKDLLHTLILDEGDQLLDLGFSKDLEKIYGQVKRDGLQTALYSATKPEGFDDFLKTVFKDTHFEEITCQGLHGIKQNIETYNIYLGVKEKEMMTVTLLEKECKGRGIIFLNKKESVYKLYQVLKDSFAHRRIWALHGDLSYSERKAAHKNFAEKGGVLVASDIAARGLDIKDLNWVLNYDLPFESVYYIHRCGRCGRNMRKGIVYNLVTSIDAKLVQRINQAIDKQSSLKIKLINAPKGSRPGGKNRKKIVKSTRDRKKTLNKSSKKAKKTPRYKRKRC